MADIQEWNGVKVLDAWSMACIQTGNKFTHYEVRVVARKPGRPLEPTALAVFARWDELNPAKELATAIVESFARSPCLGRPISRRNFFVRRDGKVQRISWAEYWHLQRNGGR